jgi:hypothetical protein
MRFKIFSILSTSFCVVVADYNLWFRTCTSGVGEGSTWSQAVASTDRDGQCGGCGTWGDVGGGEARGGNPVRFNYFNSRFRSPPKWPHRRGMVIPVADTDENIV